VSCAPSFRSTRRSIARRGNSSSSERWCTAPHRTACLARRPLLCVPACACLRASLPAARLPVLCHPWSVRPLLAMYALAALIRATLAYARHSLAPAISARLRSRSASCYVAARWATSSGCSRCWPLACRCSVRTRYACSAHTHTPDRHKAAGTLTPAAQHGQTGLHMAAKNNHAHVAQCLLDAKASVTDIDRVRSLPTRRHTRRHTLVGVAHARLSATTERRHAAASGVRTRASRVRAAAARALPERCLAPQQGGLAADPHVLQIGPRRPRARAALDRSRLGAADRRQHGMVVDEAPPRSRRLAHVISRHPQAGNTLLHLACYYQRPELAQYLIQNVMAISLEAKNNVPTHLSRSCSRPHSLTVAALVRMATRRCMWRARMAICQSYRCSCTTVPT